MSVPLEVGLLGATGIAGRAMVAPARRVAGVHVRAVAATDPARAAVFAKEHDIPQVLLSYDALLADPAIDVVYLSMHSGAHGRWALAAAEAGKHVVVEKPLCLRRDELVALRAAASEAGVVVVEAVMTTGHPWQAAVREMIAERELVEVRSRLGFDAADATSFRYDPALGGGAWFDTASYWLQALQATVGLDGAVATGSSAFAGPNGVDDRFTARLDWADGVAAVAKCSIGHGYAAGHELVFADGSVRLRNFLRPALAAFRLNLAVVGPGDATRVASFPPRHYYDDQLARIVRLVEAGGTAALDEAVPRIELMIDAYEAACRARP